MICALEEFLACSKLLRVSSLMPWMFFFLRLNDPKDGKAGELRADAFCFWTANGYGKDDKRNVELSKKRFM